MDSSSSRATKNCSTNSTKGSTEVIDSGEYKTIYKKWFHKPVPPGIGTTTHEAT